MVTESTTGRERDIIWLNILSKALSYIQITSESFGLCNFPSKIIEMISFPVKNPIDFEKQFPSILFNGCNWRKN